jgi:hypothetical protein
VSSTFSVAKSALGFTEGGASPKVDAAATFASDALAVGVAVYLDTPDDDGALAEALNATAPLGYTLTAYAQSADDNIGSMMLSGASNSTDNIPSSVVTAFIQSVTYANTKTMLTPGARTVRFVVLKAGTPNNQVISYAARAMTVSLTNSECAQEWGGRRGRRRRRSSVRVWGMGGRAGGCIPPPTCHFAPPIIPPRLPLRRSHGRLRRCAHADGHAERHLHGGERLCDRHVPVCGRHHRGGRG